MAKLQWVDGAEITDLGEIPEELIVACCHQMKAPAEPPKRLTGTALTAFRVADYAEKRSEILRWLAANPRLWEPDSDGHYRQTGTVFEEYQRDRTGWTRAQAASKGFEALLAAPTRTDFKAKWPEA